MNNDIKTAKYYSPAKMRRATMLMEQFWLLFNAPGLTDDERKCAKGMFEHYRRLAMCILMKEMPEQYMEDLIIDVDYMKNMYEKYAM